MDGIWNAITPNRKTPMSKRDALALEAAADYMELANGWYHGAGTPESSQSAPCAGLAIGQVCSDSRKRGAKDAFLEYLGIPPERGFFAIYYD